MSIYHRHRHGFAAPTSGQPSADLAESTTRRLRGDDGLLDLAPVGVARAMPEAPFSMTMSWRPSKRPTWALSCFRFGDGTSQGRPD